MHLVNALRARLFGDDGDEPPVPEPELAAEGLLREGEPTEDTPEPEAVSDAAQPFADAVPGRQERAAGRILDDEGLRGDLTDDEYQPLLDWALTVTDQLAAATAEQDDAQAEASLDTGLQAVKDALRAAQDAIVAQREGRFDDQQAALDAAHAAVASLGIEAADMPLPAPPEPAAEGVSEPEADS